MALLDPLGYRQIKLMTPYAEIASEYYDQFHSTCRNFDAATRAALDGREFPLESGPILEVGCGRGRSQEFLGVPWTRVVQLDSSKEMLSLLDREPSVVRVLADALSVPLLDRQFNTVVGFLIDAFIGLAFFAEVYRLLVPDGLFLATTPTTAWGHALRGTKEPEASIARFVTKSKRTVTVPSTLVHEDRIVEMLSFCGFVSVAVHVGYLPHTVSRVSPDVKAAASAVGVEVHELPLIYLIEARTPA